jgi:hypothetical protein
MATLSFISASKLVDLLKATDSHREMHVRVLSANKLALGADPIQPTHVIDLSKEKVSIYDPASSSRPATAAPVGVATFDQPKLRAGKMTRRSGDHWFEFNGHRTECRSLKELLAEGLKSIEKSKPGTLEKLSRIKPRSRRIVAREPKQLFESEHLIRDYAEKLTNDWWYGTNNSAAETDAWLERACTYADFKWGTEFRTSVTAANEAAVNELLAEIS